MAWRKAPGAVNEAANWSCKAPMAKAEAKPAAAPKGLGGLGSEHVGRRLSPDAL